MTPHGLASVLPPRTQPAGYYVAVDSTQPEAGQPQPDHVKSQRPRRGVVSPQMNDINSWKCFYEGVFPLLVSTSLKNTDLEINNVHGCKGANADFLPHPWPRHFCFLPSSTVQCLPREAQEDQAPRREGVCPSEMSCGDTWSSIGEHTGPPALWTLPTSISLGPMPFKKQKGGTFLKEEVLLG